MEILCSNDYLTSISAPPPQGANPHFTPSAVSKVNREAMQPSKSKVQPATSTQPSAAELKKRSSRPVTLNKNRGSCDQILESEEVLDLLHPPPAVDHPSIPPGSPPPSRRKPDESAAGTNETHLLNESPTIQYPRNPAPSMLSRRGSNSRSPSPSAAKEDRKNFAESINVRLSSVKSRESITDDNGNAAPRVSSPVPSPTLSQTKGRSTHKPAAGAIGASKVTPKNPTPSTPVKTPAKTPVRKYIESSIEAPVTGPPRRITLSRLGEGGNVIEELWKPGGDEKNLNENNEFHPEAPLNDNSDLGGHASGEKINDDDVPNTAVLAKVLPQIIVEEEGGEGWKDEEKEEDEKKQDGKTEEATENEENLENFGVSATSWQSLASFSHKADNNNEDNNNNNVECKGEETEEEVAPPLATDEQKTTDDNEQKGIAETGLIGEQKSINANYSKHRDSQMSSAERQQRERSPANNTRDNVLSQSSERKASEGGGRERSSTNNHRVNAGSGGGERARTRSDGKGGRVEGGKTLGNEDRTDSRGGSGGGARGVSGGGGGGGTAGSGRGESAGSGNRSHPAGKSGLKIERDVSGDSRGSAKGVSGGATAKGVSGEAQGGGARVGGKSASGGSGKSAGNGGAAVKGGAKVDKGLTGVEKGKESSGISKDEVPKSSGRGRSGVKSTSADKRAVKPCTIDKTKKR